MPFNISEVVNLGFAVFVAIFLLTRLDNTLNSLDKTIQQLTAVVKNTKKQSLDTASMIDDQEDVLLENNAHLLDLKDEVSKIPKRGE